MRYAVLILLLLGLPVVTGCKQEKGAGKAGPAKMADKRPELQDVVEGEPDSSSESPRDIRAARVPDTSKSGDGGVSTAAQDNLVPSLADFSWTLEPAYLDVMRDTKVVISAVWEGVSPERYRCVWDTGDRTGPVEGCRIEHTYRSGLADRTVKLSLGYDGKEVLSEARELPLERLPVHELSTGPIRLPRPPGEDGGVRALFWGLFERPDETGMKEIINALEAVRPSLVFLFVNYRPDADMEAKLLTLLNEGMEWTALPLYCQAESGQSLPNVRNPRLLMHGEGNNPPYRMAFLASSVLFTMLDPTVRQNSLDQEKWMLGQLEDGKVASHRAVISCRSLDKFTSRDAGELTPQFRYYEKLLRGDISLLVSSGYPVFFHGRYGNLPVVSAGCGTGKPGRLMSSKKAQPNLLTVVDFFPKRSPVVYPVSPDKTEFALDQTGFPFKVGNYDREL